LKVGDKDRDLHSFSV